MVVYDYSTNKALCYPTPQQDLDHVHLPPTHHKWGASRFDKNIGRVICRGMGFTHLEGVYRVKLEDEEIERTKLTVECLGYEALLSHCVTFDARNSTCEFLMGLECGSCSKKIDLIEGETEVVTSPEYPNYSDDVMCVWRLQAPALATITINFTDFRLPNLDSEGQCARGALEVAEVVVLEQQPVTRTVVSMCGGALPTPLTLHAQAVLLKYTSGVFYPRPFSRHGGFKVLVTASAIEWSPARLKTGEVVSVVLAVLLVLLAITMICYICRRSTLGRQRSRQRKLMQERLAFQRPSSHDVALSAMLASMRTLQSAGQQFTQHKLDVGEDRDSGGGGECRGGSGKSWVRDECVTRTTSMPIRQSNFSVPPPPPLPTSAPPPPITRTRLQTLPVISLPSSQDYSEGYDQPIYMEVDQYGRSPLETYLQLEDINGKEGGKERSSPLATTPSAPPFPTQAAYTKDHICCPSNSPSCVWTSCSCLSPTSKALSNCNAPSKAIVNYINVSVNHLSISSRGSSMSSNTGGVSPSPRHTPVNLCPHLGSTLGYSSGCTKPASDILSPKLQNIQQQQRQPDTPSNLTTPSLKPLVTDTTFSSCESVFTQGENSLNEGIRCACGSTHMPQTRRGLSPTIAFQDHLSKSCGDMSPDAPIEQNPMLHELVRSEPSLPRDHQSPGLVGPVLRRVSQMFLGSSPFLWPSPETKKPDLKKTKPGKSSEGKGSSGGVTGSKTGDDARCWGDKMILSGNQSPSCEASSSFLNPFRYNLLQSNNTDCVSLNGWPESVKTEAPHSLDCSQTK